MARRPDHHTRAHLLRPDACVEPDGGRRLGRQLPARRPTHIAGLDALRRRTSSVAAHSQGTRRHRAFSPRLRLVIVLGGLPEPDWLNEPYYDADGTFRGIPDMRFRRPSFGIEYDGEQHAEAEHRLADLRRENGMLLGDLPLLRYVAKDVYGTPQLIVREVGTMLSRAA